jgi:hypothetical protein
MSPRILGFTKDRFVLALRTHWLRWSLVAVAVGLCHLLEWYWLCVLTASLNQQGSAMLGVPCYRLAPDLLGFPGVTARFVVSCTMADVWCGAIPLVWDLEEGISSNLSYLVYLAVVVFVLNTVRLAASNFVVFRLGVPWTIGHQSLAALGYLLIWLLIQRRGAWRKPASRLMLAPGQPEAA